MGKKDNRGWSSTPIRQLVENRDFGSDSSDDKKQLELLVQGLKKKDRDKIVDMALSKFIDSEELKPYQAELIRLQTHLDKTGRKVIILFDGRDASGKGGTIRRVTRYMNEKHYRVIALGKPTKNQLTELHMKRYIEHFPHAGQTVLFDRSWYNRAMVEPIMGFCTKKQYRDFIAKVNGYEESFVADGQTSLIKLYFSVSKKEQQRRFERRRDDPLRQWKLSEIDLQAQELWDEFSEAKYQLLKRTHTAKNPWWVIRSDNKQKARIETMKLILSVVKYRGRRRKLNFVPDPKIVIPGDVECKRMRRSKQKRGVYVR
ncbi:MAG: polyphosphate kinase 2 [Woeseiaceae bacterium]